MTEFPAGQLAQLEAFLRSRGICRGPLTARPVGDGHSNLTFRVNDGHRQVVVRMPHLRRWPPARMTCSARRR
jgi:aminoglycoside phosphotransferase (APT) family kinase protein